MKKICTKNIITFILASAIVLTSSLSADTLAASKNNINWDVLLTVPDDAESEKNPEERMAHNIYSDPVLTKTSGKYSGFLIDFKADKAGNSTYWALCNWNMNIDNLKSKCKKIQSNGGAYAGLQTCSDGPKGIMSFWQISYITNFGKEATIEASRTYPPGSATNRFTNEGEGSNYIRNYPWKQGKWYRMYLNCYQNNTGRTFVEQWFADLSSGKWTLFSRFDTGLYHSYFEGSMSQFMENFYHMHSNQSRSFEYKNIHVREYGQTHWTPVTKSYLSIDTNYHNKKGDAVYGAVNNRFYGIANGYGEDVFPEDKAIGDTYTVKTVSNIIIPSSSGKNKAVSILIDNAKLTKKALQKLIKKNNVKSIRLINLQKNTQKKYQKWICDINNEIDIIQK